MSISVHLYSLKIKKKWHFPACPPGELASTCPAHTPARAPTVLRTSPNCHSGAHRVLSHLVSTQADPKFQGPDRLDCTGFLGCPLQHPWPCSIPPGVALGVTQLSHWIRGHLTSARASLFQAWEPRGVPPPSSAWWGGGREWTYGCWRKQPYVGEGIGREFGMDMDTLLYLKWITNKDLLGDFGGERTHV